MVYMGANNYGSSEPISERSMSHMGWNMTVLNRDMGSMWERHIYCAECDTWRRSKRKILKRVGLRESVI